MDRNTARDVAQKLADNSQTPYGVWEHVGVYGRPNGDLLAQHTFMVRDLRRPDPHPCWALVECADPKEKTNGEA